jgi:trans-aconitate methyltransferase
VNNLNATAADDWEEHWSEFTAAAESNPAQRYRRKVLLRLLHVHGCGTGARILDIGSGQGDLAADLCSEFTRADVLGIELSATGVEVAKKKVPCARFLQRDLLGSSELPQEFLRWAQFATCSEVLEHLDEPRQLLSNATEYLAPGCVLIVTVPGGPRSAFDTHIGHRQHFTDASITRLLEDCGFQDVRAMRAGFPFFNLYRLVVILRGKKLVVDAAASSRGSMSIVARTVMRVFGILFKVNLSDSPWGWQMVAIGRWPGSGDPHASETSSDQARR